MSGGITDDWSIRGWILAMGGAQCAMLPLEITSRLLLPLHICILKLFANSDITISKQLDFYDSGEVRKFTQCSIINGLKYFFNNCWRVCKQFSFCIHSRNAEVKPSTFRFLIPIQFHEVFLITIYSN